MARKIHRLSALAAAKATRPGLYGDGGGLYLQITPAGVKSWLYRYMRQGKAHGMGLGPLHTINLAEARVKALACRKLLLEGNDPLEAKRHHHAALSLASAKSLTFEQCASSYIASHKAGWKNAKHAAQWTSTLETYAYPVFGKLPVAVIDTALVMKALEPIWTTKTETATRVRGRVESVLDWATVRGYREGENPARWKGHLDHLLPKRSKVTKVQHHPALAYAEASTFFDELRMQEGIAARALEFLILTACRTNEVIGARWSEFDFAEKTWTVPASRMKTSKEHRVPLSPHALSIVKALRKQVQSDFVFPGLHAGKPLSNMAMLELLKRMKREALTVHGFRSTFRDWVGETTNYPREVAEAALAHTIKDKAEAAYARGDLFAKRRHLFEDWAKYLIAPASQRRKR